MIAEEGDEFERAQSTKDYSLKEGEKLAINLKSGGSTRRERKTTGGGLLAPPPGDTPSRRAPKPSGGLLGDPTPVAAPAAQPRINTAVPTTTSGFDDIFSPTSTSVRPASSGFGDLGFSTPAAGAATSSQLGGADFFNAPATTTSPVYGSGFGTSSTSSFGSGSSLGVHDPFSTMGSMGSALPQQQ